MLIPPNSNGFNLFGFTIHYYSICIFLAIALSLFVLNFIVKYFNKVKKEILFDLAVPVIIFGILGARVYYVLLSFDYYMKYPYEIIMINHGGLSIHGAIIAGAIAGLIYLNKKGENFFAYADIISVVLPLGQAIGRWGNFFNSEAFGYPVTAEYPFALYIKENLRPYEFKNYECFHPCFLYESILDILIFVILLFILKTSVKNKKSLPEGFLFGLYIILYSIVRIIIEPVRLDTVAYIFNLPVPVIVSLFGIIFGGYICWKKRPA